MKEGKYKKENCWIKWKNAEHWKRVQQIAQKRRVKEAKTLYFIPKYIIVLTGLAVTVVHTHFTFMFLNEHIE